MLHLIETLVGKAACHGHTPLAQQAEGDEVAVPTIHFVKPAAGHHIASGQEKQAVLVDARSVRGQHFEAQ